MEKVFNQAKIMTLLKIVRFMLQGDPSFRGKSFITVRYISNTKKFSGR
jgi:hypothetical protein